jgi:hypothetical protein
MKNGIILLLSVVLCAAAFLTRPTEDDFGDLVERHAARDNRSMPERLVNKSSRPERSLAKAEMVDRYLWVEVRRDGRTLYAGLFNHWWDSRGRMQRV